ncbi:MAG: CDP-alcohol phosphatidyltransferase family protein [Lachnospiraceae bacterium]|nr:CDP-alcohol phosphatidyltransferase family protein [Candidatus Minthocola equi]
MAANCITFSRIVFSLLLFAFYLYTIPFAIFYLLCGMTDVLDGFVARKLNTESENGALLDSVADLIFAAAYAAKILPILDIPLWIWIWTAIIAIIKVTGILIASKKAHRLLIEHSFGNKLTGLLLFLLPISVYIADVKYGATVVCVAATITAIKEINICRKDK